MMAASAQEHPVFAQQCGIAVLSHTQHQHEGDRQQQSLNPPGGTDIVPLLTAQFIS